jgi:5'-3' exonuclease
MGIPSYFSYIIKNYPNIIRNLQYFINSDEIRLDNLFMDCNSIIYDAVRSIESNDQSKHLSVSEIESFIIDNVILNIKKYIQLITPRNSVFIAFDGVAPYAKMEQQRTRRYKSAYMSKINNKPSLWNTSAITPGTKFMRELSNRIHMEFSHTESKYNIKKFIISCSDEAGEGEHKIMEYIRNNSNICNETIALYGLDADLIMLSIFHLKYAKNIYVFREAPEFIKSSIPVQIQGGIQDLYFLDIHNLSNSILKEMNCSSPDPHRINDYVFLCFILGNDFLPHFPAMNIRTHGIQALLDIYRLYVGNDSRRFFISKSNNKIQWKTVSVFIQEIAKREHEFLMNEYFVRDKFDKRNWNETTDEEKDEAILNIPVIFRGEEKYICPGEHGWENRYYKTLFHSETSSDLIKSVSINYVEGLEWVHKYYTTGCCSWKWKYNYSYPPLFKDLLKYVPHFETDFIKPCFNNSAFCPEAQLSYVLPKSQLGLLPNNIFQFLKTHYSELYPEEYEFQWAFCRYFWESHPILPEISIELLEQWDIQFKLAANQS